MNALRRSARIQSRDREQWTVTIDNERALEFMYSQTERENSVIGLPQIGNDFAPCVSLFDYNRFGEYLFNISTAHRHDIRMQLMMRGQCIFWIYDKKQRYDSSVSEQRKEVEKWKSVKFVQDLKGEKYKALK